MECERCHETKIKITLVAAWSLPGYNQIRNCITMSQINPSTTAMQVDQSQCSGAISCLAAVVKELSKDPKNALSKPIGYWLPWLQEEGYASEGFDHLLLNIVPQEHQTQDFDTISSAYVEAKNSGYTTLKFLLSLKQRDSGLFAAGRAAGQHMRRQANWPSCHIY